MIRELKQKADELKSRLGIAQLVARTAKDAAAQTNKPGDRAVMVRALGDARVLEKELQAVETALYHEEDLVDVRD